MHKARLRKLTQMNILKENKPQVQHDVLSPLIIKKKKKIQDSEIT